MQDAGASSAPSSTITDLSGRVFNARYRLARKVGSGSMGDVYEGRRIADDLQIAVKVLKPEHTADEVFRHRFLREAKSTVAVQHPNVVDVMDFGEAEGGWLYIVMEFLQGEELSEYLDRLKRLTWKQSCALLQQAATGLAAAHELGIVHRDVKPSNILLVDDKAGGARVKIVDFGVAKLADSAQSRVLTQVDAVIGTVHYMSPEQAEGGDADHRSDIYSLGITAYELATGQVPFDGRDMFVIMMGHLQREPTPPSELVADFPPAANAFILRCLAKQPHDRFDTMQEVLAVLQTTASPDAVALPPPVLNDVDDTPPSTDRAEAPQTAEFDEAPTGYFFRPVQPSAVHTDPGAAAVVTRLDSSETKRPPPPSVEVTQRTPIRPMPDLTGLPGGTVRVPSVHSPVIDPAEFDEPAGQMPTVTIVAIIAITTAAMAYVVYVLALA